MIRLALGILLLGLSLGLGLPARADTAPETVMIPVLARDLATGEVITADDLVDMPFNAPIAAAIADSADDIVGMAARKPLRAGRPVARTEIRQPILVPKGSLVTVRVSMPGIELATTAKAMEQGAMGDVIRVLNLTSNRVVQGVVTGPGQAMVPVTPQPVLLSAAATPRM